MTKSSFIVNFLLFTLFLIVLANPVLAGFKRNLENGLFSGSPGGYHPTPKQYQVGDTFRANIWLNNPADHDIGDNFWLEISRIEKCELSSGTIEVTNGNPELTEEELNQCSGENLDKVVRTQKDWWSQDKHYEVVKQGRSAEISGAWKIDKEGYYQFDFFSESTWAYGPFATGFFRVLSSSSASPSPSSGFNVSPSPSPSSSPSAVPVASEQPKSGGNLWVLAILGLITLGSGAGFLYLLGHPEALKRASKKKKN